ncbi:hypothetical protein LCGC14_1562330 [marine sediment metagenome]|uniref:Resolvase/invertase-type recombinase catalytic domain-containing protein n=1 Tax=marine sediment metagenome TaxID=412755 RepID=A0A0F9IM39_9ZZZZ
MKKIAVYIRVSTGGQDHASQEPDLKRWLEAYGADQSVKWYRETFTGKTMDRPVMRELEADIQAGEISKLVVWRLDRLGRTAVHTLRFLDELTDRGVIFATVRDGIDTSTTSGRLMRTILAGFAEYEREVISERVRAGIARAKAEGKTWGGRKPGNRPRLTPVAVRSIQAMLEAKVSKVDIAKELHIDRSTVYQAIKMISKNGGGVHP